MRLIMVLLLALVTSSLARGQMSVEEAMRHLKERQLHRTPPATRPATMPVDPDAAAREALQLTADDVDVVVAAVRLDENALHACFNRIRNQPFRIAATALDVKAKVPGGNARAMLVRFTLQPTRAVDRRWKQELAALGARYVEKKKLFIDGSKSYFYYRDQAYQAFFKRQLQQLDDERDLALKEFEFARPSPPIVELYLTAPDALLDSIKPGGLIRGTVTFVDGHVTIGEWQDQTVTKYMDHMIVTGFFVPDRLHPGGQRDYTPPR